MFASQNFLDMSNYYKCAWCGRSFEKSGGSKFLSGATMGLSNLGKKYCSKSCEHSAELSKNGNSSVQQQSSSPVHNSNTTVVNKGPGFGSFMGKAIGDTVTGTFTGGLDMMKETKQQQLAEEREKKNKIEDLALMKMSSDSDELMDQLNYLASLASSKPDKAIKKVIIEKMEFGIMKLRSANSNGEADFFESKLAPLKKSGWF
jgi:hypothetical protein